MIYVWAEDDGYECATHFVRSDLPPSGVLAFLAAHGKRGVKPSGEVQGTAERIDWLGEDPSCELYQAVNPGDFFERRSERHAAVPTLLWEKTPACVLDYLAGAWERASRDWVPYRIIEDYRRWREEYDRRRGQNAGQTPTL